jgi:hypothetical protein
MKIIRLIVVMIAIAIFTSSCIRKPNERNKLAFKDKVENVQDSLSKMENLLSKLPKRNDNKNINYYNEDGKLFINDSLINKSFITSSLFSDIYTSGQKKDFLELSDYLNMNFLSSAYFDEADKLWRFIYKDFPQRTFNDTRDVCILDYSKVLLLSRDTILDHEDKVYLLAPKGVKIR